MTLDHPHFLSGRIMWPTPTSYAIRTKSVTTRSLHVLRGPKQTSHDLNASVRYWITVARRVRNTMASFFHSGQSLMLVAYCVLDKVEIKVHCAAREHTISQHPLLKWLLCRHGIALVPLLETSWLCVYTSASGLSLLWRRLFCLSLC